MRRACARARLQPSWPRHISWHGVVVTRDDVVVVTRGRGALLLQDCSFLGEDKKCSIHTVRPSQCSTYPWWPELMHPKEWDWEKGESLWGPRGGGLRAPIMTCDVGAPRDYANHDVMGEG